MARSFRITGAVIAIIVFCVIAGLGLAQVPIIPDAPAKPRPSPGALSPAKVAPGTLSNDPATLSKDPGTPPKEPGMPAKKEDAGVPPSTPDPEVPISPAGEPIVLRVVNIMAPVTVTDQNGNLMPALQP